MSEESSADYLSRVRAEWEPESAQDRIAALEAELERRANIIRATEVERDAGDKVADNLRAKLQKAERERDEAREQSERLRVEVNKGTEAFFKIAAIRTRFEEDNATLRAKLAESEAYADKLAAGLPMLPADIENLRNANFEFAKENDELRAHVAELRAKVDGLAERLQESTGQLAAAARVYVGHDHIQGAGVLELSVAVNEAMLARCQPASAADPLEG